MRGRACGALAAVFLALFTSIDSARAANDPAQLYLASDLTGQLTAQAISFDARAQKIAIATTPNWVTSLPPQKPVAEAPLTSPVWVGPAQTYDRGITFKDHVWGASDTPQETSYDDFRAAQQARLKVVYFAANDGFVHGFRANDGYEVLRYMPSAVLGHAGSVAATPASGDLFYHGTWHTWLVGGWGAGGAIYALDITNPGSFKASATNSNVVGEWSAANLTCINVPNCRQSLGDTSGTPLVRRFHNGSWGVIFGNGFGSARKSAGIYILLVDPASGNTSVYYLAAPATTNTAANGIASPTTADIDLDHIIDYIYAGDLQGNVWRFDVTSADPDRWGCTATAPLFTTPAGAPITTGLTVSVLRQFVLPAGGGLGIDTAKPGRVIVNFGTGQRVAGKPPSAAQNATPSQYLFGIWDWNFDAPQSGWNTLSRVPLVALDPGKGPATVPVAALQSHTVATIPQAAPAMTYRTISQEPVCWVVYEPYDAGPGCPNPGTQYGWYIALPGTQEQIVFDPAISPDGELVVNTSSGFTMAMSPGTGSADPGGTGATAQSYFTVESGSGVVTADALQLKGTGTPWFLSAYLITRTAIGAAPPTAVNRHTVVAGKRLNWVQRR